MHIVVHVNVQECTWYIHYDYVFILFCVFAHDSIMSSEETVGEHVSFFDVYCDCGLQTTSFFYFYFKTFIKKHMIM